MAYSVTYYRHDTKVTETKQVVNADTMQEAVKIIVTRATKANVKISRISCTVEGSQGVQRFCEECLCTPANFGSKGNIIKCKECKNE